MVANLTGLADSPVTDVYLTWNETLLCFMNIQVFGGICSSLWGDVSRASIFKVEVELCRIFLCKKVEEKFTCDELVSWISGSSGS